MLPLLLIESGDKIDQLYYINRPSTCMEKIVFASNKTLQRTQEWLTDNVLDLFTFPNIGQSRLWITLPENTCRAKLTTQKL
jgi:hypothetical protein